MEVVKRCIFINLIFTICRLLLMAGLLSLLFQFWYCKGVRHLQNAV
jgi:hypothetical protein